MSVSVLGFLVGDKAVQVLAVDVVSGFGDGCFVFHVVSPESFGFS